MKRIGIHAVVLSALCIAAGYYFSEAFLSAWFDHVLRGAINLKVLNTSVSDNFWLRQNTVLSLGIPPLLTFGLLGLVRGIRRKEPAVQQFYGLTLVLFAAYFLAIVLKYFVLRWEISEFGAYQIAPDVINAISVTQLAFYGWATAGAVISGFVVFIVILRRK